MYTARPSFLTSRTMRSLRKSEREQLKESTPLTLSTFPLLSAPGIPQRPGSREDLSVGIWKEACQGRTAAERTHLAHTHPKSIGYVWLGSTRLRGHCEDCGQFLSPLQDSQRNPGRSKLQKGLGHRQYSLGIAYYGCACV